MSLSPQLLPGIMQIQQVRQTSQQSCRAGLQTQVLVGTDEAADIRITGPNAHARHAEIRRSPGRTTCTALVGDEDDLLADTYTWIDGDQLRTGVLIERFCGGHKNAVHTILDFLLACQQDVTSENMKSNSISLTDLSNLGFQLRYMVAYLLASCQRSVSKECLFC